MLTLIIGPMKSSKSYELIARTEPFRYANKSIMYIKPKRDVRSSEVKSRLGTSVEAVEYDEIPLATPVCDVIAIDEAHMFSDFKEQVAEWLKTKEVLIAGLNTDHAGRLMPTIASLLELSPDVLINKQAVCERCGSPATHTQVTLNGEVVDKRLPPELPDDGTYEYEAVCRRCFR